MTDDVKKKEPRHKSYTNLRIKPEIRQRAKAAAAYLNMEFYELAETAIEEKLDRLKEEGKISF